MEFRKTGKYLFHADGRAHADLWGQLGCQCSKMYEERQTQYGYAF